MPQFHYEARKGPDDLITGVMEGDSPKAVAAQLRDMGLLPVSVTLDEGKTIEVTTPKARRRRIKLADRNIFFRQIANLYESGMTLTRGLTTMAAQSENPGMTHIIEQIREDIQRGSTFAEALEHHPKVFPPMYTSLVRAGESGGMLDEVLWRIVTFGEQDEELRGKAVMATIYPAFLAVMGTIAVFILVSFVFPKFIQVFNDFNATLPWPTLVVMGLCSFMEKWWWAVLAGAVVTIFSLLRYFRTDAGRMRFDRHLLSLPVAGKVAQKYQMAMFSRILGTLLDNGVPVLSGIRITGDTLTNRVISGEVRQVLERVAGGDSISVSLAHCPHFPPMVVNMIAVGEESGRLGDVTKRMASAYDNEVDRAVKAMAAMLEPVMIVIMGVVIGFLVIAMLLPLLTLSGQVN